MSHEDAIRKRVKTLKQFYMDVFTFVLINSIIVLIWLVFDQTGTFWPLGGGLRNHKKISLWS